MIAEQCGMSLVIGATGSVMVVLEDDGSGREPWLLRLCAASLDLLDRQDGVLGSVALNRKTLQAMRDGTSDEGILVIQLDDSGDPVRLSTVVLDRGLCAQAAH